MGHSSRLDSLEPDAGAVARWLTSLLTQGMLMFFNQHMTRFSVRASGLAIAAAVLSGLGTVSWARAQAPERKTLELTPPRLETKREDNPQARALFGEVAKAYKALSSYSDEGEFVIAMTAGGKTQKQVLPMKLTMVRPNKLDFDAGQVQITSDGTTLTTAVKPLKRYASTTAPKSVGMETFREGPLGSVLFGGPTGPAMFVLLNLLTAADPAAAIGQLGGSLQPATDGAANSPKADGAGKPATSAILIDLAEGQPDILLTVDPATKLLSGIDLKLAPELLARAAQAGQELKVDRFGWSSGAVSTQVAKDRSFAYAAPKDFAKVDSLLEKQEEQHPTDKAVGKPAPDFTLTLLDGPGKTKTLKKAELAGKVVVIDFWATWCGPCLMELPEIQKLIDSYADSKKEVLVVALSQDDDPSELSALRKLVEKTLADKKINLTGNSIGQIGLDPSKSVGSAFGLEGYPTLVILDGRGIVQSVHVGFNPQAAEPLHKTLAKEIDTLLEGKSLAGTKDKAKEASTKAGNEKP
jgi:thiol-disulfide isomerase/thioredoxin